MTRDSSINRVDDFERLAQVLEQLNISVRRADGSFRCISEVLDDLMSTARVRSFSASLLVAEAYDILSAALFDSNTRDIISTGWWLRSPMTSGSSPWNVSSTANNDYLDTWRYTTAGYALGHNTLTTPATMSIQPPCKKQTDCFDNPDHEAIDNFLAGFKIIERKAG